MRCSVACLLLNMMCIAFIMCIATHMNTQYKSVICLSINSNFGKCIFSCRDLLLFEKKIVVV